MEPIATYHLLGVTVNAFTVDTFYATIRRSVEHKSSCIVGNHNLHSIYLYHHDAIMRQFYTITDYVFIDGMPIVLWGSVLGYDLGRRNRLTCVDWVPPLMEICAREGWRVYHLGGRPGVAERAAVMLRDQLPGLQIETRHGYFDPHSEAENTAIVNAINAAQPDILLVGMGMPRQEHWVHAQAERLQPSCIIPTGAAFDYLAGEIPTPPRGISRWGFEWLARLIAEPRRLGRRYLIEPWFLLPHMLRDLRQRGTNQAEPDA